jgi:hypothetical protein
VAMFQSEQFGNNPSTTVAANGYNGGSATGDAPASNTQETWTVTSSTEFPAASDTADPTTGFRISDPAAPTEIIGVINVSGDTWILIRGIEGTTPVTHAAGATFYQVVTAGSLGLLAQKETLAAGGLVSANDTATTETVFSYTPSTQDQPAAGVAYEFFAFGTLNTYTGGTTTADFNLTFTLSWNGVTLATFSTENADFPLLSSSISYSGFWLEGAVICLSATSMVAGMNFMTKKLQTSYSIPTASGDHTAAMAGVTVSGAGPLKLTVAWSTAETTNLLTCIGAAKRWS